MAALKRNGTDPYALSQGLIFVALERDGAPYTAVADGRRLEPLVIATDRSRVQQRLRELGQLEARPLAAWSDLLAGLSDAESFAAAGLLQRPDPESRTTGAELGQTDLDFQVVVNSGCNLRCGYCYEGAQTDRNDQVASAGTLRRVFAEVADRLPSLNRITANFIGGEPLLSWRDTLSAIENLHEVAESRGVACAITLQTNLTFLPQGFIAAVKQHRIFVLANIDGDRGVHDAARPHKVSRRSSYDETSRCLAELRSNHVQFGLRCTVTRHNAGMLSEIAQLHEDLGAAVSVFKMLVPVAYNGQSMEHLLPDIDVYREGLRRFMSTRDWTDQAWCREFINTIEAVRGGSAPQSANCSAANANSYTIDQSGHIYNCPNLIGNAHFDTGPLSGLDHGRRTEIGGLLARQRDPVCGRCSYRFVCTSACLLPKVLGVGDAQALMSRARELQCATTKPIVDDLIRRMSHQVLDGRAPILPEHRLGVADLAPEWRSWLLSVVGSPAETVEAQLVSSGYFSASQAHALVIEAMQLEPSVRA